MTGPTKTTHKTEAVDAFVLRYSTSTGTKPQSVHTFKDGSEIKRRDVFKHINTLQMKALGKDEGAAAELAQLAGVSTEDHALNADALQFVKVINIKDDTASYDLKADVQQTVARLRTLPRLSLAVYVALYSMLYAEPGFSDVTTEQIAEKLKLDVNKVKGALSNLHNLFLVFPDSMNGEMFQHPAIWSNPLRAEVTLSGMGFTQDEVNDIIANPLGTSATDGKAKKETPMTQNDALPNETDAVAQDTEVVETLTPEPGTAEAKPKKVAAPKELTPEQQAAQEEYLARYGKKGDKEIDLTTRTKTGAESKMSLEARARMSAAAKARWQDPAKKAQLEAAFKARSERINAGQAEKIAAKKKAQEERAAKREAQQAAAKAKKEAADAAKAAKANKPKKAKAPKPDAAPAAQ